MPAPIASLSIWALDVGDYTHNGEREVGFIPRPLTPPRELLLMASNVSLRLLMDRGRGQRIGPSLGWFFPDDPRQLG
ncbi:hypothetical protein ABIF16_009157 [Bradyrhizobium elkanii]